MWIYLRTLYAEKQTNMRVPGFSFVMMISVANTHMNGSVKTIMPIVIQVEVGVPGFVNPNFGNSALVYHVPAYEVALADCSRLYASIFNFFLTLITGDRGRILTIPDMEANAANLMAQWYYTKDRSSSNWRGVVAFICSGERKWGGRCWLVTLNVSTHSLQNELCAVHASPFHIM